MTKDKLLHFGAGILVAAFFTLASGRPLVGLAAAAIAGIAKETYDASHGGTVEALDAVATFVGGALAAGILYALASMGQISFQ